MKCPECERYNSLIRNILSTIDDFIMYGDDYSINPEWNDWYKELKKIEGDEGEVS